MNVQMVEKLKEKNITDDATMTVFSTFSSDEVLFYFI